MPNPAPSEVRALSDDPMGGGGWDKGAAPGKVPWLVPESQVALQSDPYVGRQPSLLGQCCSHVALLVGPWGRGQGEIEETHVSFGAALQSSTSAGTMVRATEKLRAGPGARWKLDGWVEGSPG